MSLDTYKEHNATPLQIMHFCFGMGTTLSSVWVSAIGTSGPQLNNLENTTTTNMSTTYLTTQGLEEITISPSPNSDVPSSISPIDSSHDKLPLIFGVAAVPSFISTIYFIGGFIYFIYFHSSGRGHSDSKIGASGEKSDIKTDDDSQSEVLRNTYKIWTLVWAILMLGAQIGVEIVTAGYLDTFYHKKNFSDETAHNLNTAYLVGYNAGRLIAIFVSTKIRPMPIIIALNMLYPVSAIAMHFASGHPDTPAWSYALCVLLGLGYSANYPAMFSYINSRVPITNKNSGFMLAFTGIVMAVDPLIVGQFIDTFPPVLLILIVAHCFIAMGSLGIIEYSFWIFRRSRAKYFAIRKNSARLNQFPMA